MPRNLEIKARIIDREAAVAVARAMEPRQHAELKQTDTYFQVPLGRLKLREIEGQSSELIYYRRAEQTFRRLSTFERCTIQEPSGLKGILQLAYGIKTVVRKRRLVFLLKGTRIHIDDVESLGSFLEFEVPVGSSPDEADRMMSHLVEAFKLREDDLIRESYADLMEEVTRKKEKGKSKKGGTADRVRRARITNYS